jgi:hypothetical protein
MDLAHPTTLKRMYRPGHPVPSLSQRTTTASVTTTTTAISTRRTANTATVVEEGKSMFEMMMDGSSLGGAEDAERTTTSLMNDAPHVHGGSFDFDVLSHDYPPQLLVTPASASCDPQRLFTS